MVQLVIGNKNYSSWSLRAWITLRKAGIPFEEIRVPLYVEGYKDELLRHGPAGLVPVYKDAGFVLWDSLAICEFVAEAHPQLWPMDKLQRAHARAICAEMHSGFRGIRSRLPMNCRAKNRRVELDADLGQEVRRVETIWTECRQHRDATAGRWLFGQFSIADAMYIPLALHFHTYGINMNATAAAYMENVLGDPDVQSWVAGALAEHNIIEECEVGGD